MSIYKKIRKTVSKARKGVRKVAKTYLKLRRSKIGKSYFKGGMVSSTAVAKSLSNLRTIRKDMSAGLEWKTLDQNHNTVGIPSNNTNGNAPTRYFYRINASNQLATELNTSSTLAQIQAAQGYLLKEITLPIKGTGTDNYDGQKFLVKAIQLKGGCSLIGTTDQIVANGTLRIMIVKYKDAVDQNFDISEFIQTDQNGEYSTVSRRNRNHFSNYEVIAQRKINLSYGTKTKSPMNLFVRPNAIHRHEDGAALSFKTRYFVVILASPDISNHLTQFDVNFSTRLRFIH